MEFHRRMAHAKTHVRLLEAVAEVNKSNYVPCIGQLRIPQDTTVVS